MSSSYIPKDINAICTFQTDASPRKFVPTRGTITVFYGTDLTRPLLTIEDRNINEEFPCKSAKNSAWSFIAFGAGLIVGAALVLSGPVGWAVIAVGAGMVAVGAYQATQISHKCSAGLGAGKWTEFHPTVRFDKFNALTSKSILVCDVGGLLKPIHSDAIAAEYASLISKNNNTEVALNAVASFFGGAGAVIGFAEMTVGAAAMWIAGSVAAVEAGVRVERELIRNNSLEGNEHYQQINEADPNNLLPGFLTDPTGASPSDFASPDILELNERGAFLNRDNNKPILFNGKWYIQDWQKNIIEIKQGTELANDLSALEGVDDRQVWKTDTGKRIVGDIRQGKYSESLISSSRDGTGTVRPKRLPNLRQELPQIKAQNYKNLGKLGVKGGGFVSFFFPFVSTYFSEESRKNLAQAMAADMGNGISIVAEDA